MGFVVMEPKKHCNGIKRSFSGVAVYLTTCGSKSRFAVKISEKICKKLGPKWKVASRVVAGVSDGKDGDELGFIHVCPHERGYKLSPCTRSGQGDASKMAGKYSSVTFSQKAFPEVESLFKDKNYSSGSVFPEFEITENGELRIDMNSLSVADEVNETKKPKKKEVKKYADYLGTEAFLDENTKKIYLRKDRTNGHTNFSFSKNQVTCYDWLVSLGITVIFIDEDNMSHNWKTVMKRIDHRELNAKGWVAVTL